MGAYLSEPVTAKESSDGVLTVGKRTVSYGVTAMQGWRVDMEDSHCVIPDVIENTALLSVFDGHGGREVAAYCARHIPLMLAASTSLKTKNYDKALKEVFLECDRVLLSEEAVEEMKQTLKEEYDDDSESSDEDTDQLMNEAEMPLEQLLARYGGRNTGLESEGEQSATDEEEKIKVSSSILLAIANKFGIGFDNGSSEDEDSDFSDEEEECNNEESVSSEEGSSSGGNSSRKRQRESDIDNGLTSDVPLSKRVADPSLEGNCADEGYHSGTTAIVCLVQEDQLIVANAGDSRCVLSSGGKAEDMSVDHNPTDQIELNRIENAGGNVGTDLRVNGGLNLSRAIGDHFYKKNTDLPLEKQMITSLPDVRVRPLTKDDEFVVIACDGIWNVMESQAVVDFVHEKIKSVLKDGEGKLTEAKLSLICEQLCDSCLAPNTDNDGTGCDNMTCIIALLKPGTLLT